MSQEDVFKCKLKKDEFDAFTKTQIRATKELELVVVAKYSLYYKLSRYCKGDTTFALSINFSIRNGLYSEKIGNSIIDQRCKMYVLFLDDSLLDFSFDKITTCKFTRALGVNNYDFYNMPLKLSKEKLSKLLEKGIKSIRIETYSKENDELANFDMQVKGSESFSFSQAFSCVNN